MTDSLNLATLLALPGIERFWPHAAFPGRTALRFDRPMEFVRAVEKQIPRDRPGIYVYWDETGQAIYVGKAICLRKRLLSYARTAEGFPEGATTLRKEARILLESRGALIGPCLDELGALVWERELISTWKPKWNRSHNLPLRRWLWLTRKGVRAPGSYANGKSGAGAGKAQRPFQMKALKPGDARQAWGPFRGGRWTTALKRALNARIAELCESDQERLALAYLDGKDRTYLRLWENQIAKIGDAAELARMVEAEMQSTPGSPGPLEQYQALLAYEKWRVKAARSKTLTGFTPIAPLGAQSWNCSLPPGQSYFYFLQEGRIMGTMAMARQAPASPGPLPNDFFVRETELPRGLDEPFLVGQWFDRFPVCAQSFVFAQTALFSSSADLA